MGCASSLTNTVCAGHGAFGAFGAFGKEESFPGGANSQLTGYVDSASETDEVLGGGNLHHLDAERAIVEIGYFVLPQARGRGVATTVARLLAEHAFSLGIVRVAAYVNLGNTASERVLERAGFTREGIVRSLPVPDGRRVDKTLFSLLDGE